MSIFDLDSQNFYVIGAHGCTPQRLDPTEDSIEFASNRFFTVPENFMIVYLTPNGVQSQGHKNIPFIKNLYDYNQELFKYVFNPSNYEINLDKINTSSYRHSDFFKSLPFFSNFNYLCNFELYPPGVPCPFIHLYFSKSCSDSTKCYFEGITELDNIITPEAYGEKLNFNNPSNIFNPSEHITSSNGFAYTHEIFEIIRNKFGITGGVFFVSSCRAEFFTKKGERDPILVDILPIPRNCGDISYDLAFMDNLKLEYPDSLGSIDTVTRRLQVRNTRKIQIDSLINSTYIQNTIFFNNNFAFAFYQYLCKLSGIVNICINFRKIKIDCDLDDLSDKYSSLVRLIDHKFSEFRSKLVNRPELIKECNNSILNTKFGYIYRFVYYYIKNYNDLPSQSDFLSFWSFIDSNFVEDRNQMIKIINKFIQPIYNFSLVGGMNSHKLDYKTKYLKYKNKYLDLQKIINNN